MDGLECACRLASNRLALERLHGRFRRLTGEHAVTETVRHQQSGAVRVMPNVSGVTADELARLRLGDDAHLERT